MTKGFKRKLLEAFGLQYEQIVNARLKKERVIEFI